MPAGVVLFFVCGAGIVGHFGAVVDQLEWVVDHIGEIVRHYE